MIGTPATTGGTDVARLFAGIPVVPAVVLADPDAVAPLADALTRGGLPCAEVTLRTPAAVEVIRAFARRPGLLVGAGTVTTADQVDRVVDAGARFVVSPGLSDAVVERCRALEVPVLPGVATATEIMRAIDAGLRTVKLFPARQLGGLAGLRALAAPFPGLGFVPTGGIGPDELRDYLGEPAVVAVGGTWMVNPTLVRDGRFDEVERLVREAMQVAQEVRA